MNRPQSDFVPMLLAPTGPLAFPDPNDEVGDGLVAIGGDLRAERLLLAYSTGIFPWFDDPDPPLWWSPNPRAILPVDGLHISRSLARTLRHADFQLSWNEAFEDVMRACADQRDEGTWITENMIESYRDLHRMGHAHSVEVWQDGELVGGTYGVQVGALFAAESKFRRRTDMSKVALVALVRTLASSGIQLLDVQFLTDHLASLGCVEVPRRVYLELVRRAVATDVDLARAEPFV